MKKLPVSPRLAFDPKKKKYFFDKNGDEIPTKKPGKEPPEEDRVWTENVVVKFYKSNPTCRIWFEIGGAQYCFRVDCTSGEYLGPC